MQFHSLIAVFVILIWVLYIKEDLRIEREFTILQTPLEELTYELYQKRQPIVVETIKSEESVSKPLSFGYAFSCMDTSNSDDIVSILSRYCIISPQSSSPLYIQLFHPMTETAKSARRNAHTVGPYVASAKSKYAISTSNDEQGVFVILYPEMALIVPHKWSFNSSTNARLMFLCDFMGTFIEVLQQGFQNSKASRRRSFQ